MAKTTEKAPEEQAKTPEKKPVTPKMGAQVTYYPNGRDNNFPGIEPHTATVVCVNADDTVNLCVFSRKNGAPPCLTVDNVPHKESEGIVTGYWQ